MLFLVLCLALYIIKAECCTTYHITIQTTTHYASQVYVLGNSYSKPNCGQSCKKDSDCKRDGYGHYNPCDECKFAKGSYHGYNYRKCK